MFDFDISVVLVTLVITISSWERTDEGAVKWGSQMKVQSSEGTYASWHTGTKKPAAGGNPFLSRWEVSWFTRWMVPTSKLCSRRRRRCIVHGVDDASAWREMLLWQCAWFSQAFFFACHTMRYRCSLAMIRGFASLHRRNARPFSCRGHLNLAAHLQICREENKWKHVFGCEAGGCFRRLPMLHGWKKLTRWNFCIDRWWKFFSFILCRQHLLSQWSKRACANTHTRICTHPHTALSNLHTNTLKLSHAASSHKRLLQSTPKSSKKRSSAPLVSISCTSQLRFYVAIPFAAHVSNHGFARSLLAIVSALCAEHQ